MSREGNGRGEFRVIHLILYQSSRKKIQFGTKMFQLYSKQKFPLDNKKDSYGRHTASSIELIFIEF